MIEFQFDVSISYLQIYSNLSLKKKKKEILLCNQLISISNYKVQTVFY